MLVACIPCVPQNLSDPMNYFWQMPGYEHLALGVSLQDIPAMLLCLRNLELYIHIGSHTAYA